MSVHNPYGDRSRAAGYAQIGITNTYYLAYRDLPKIFAAFGVSGVALDYGCGTGRSTRFLRSQGFSAIGADISDAMIRLAREQEPEGDFRLIEPGDLRQFTDGTFDLVLSVMPFDSIPTMAEKVATLGEIGRVMKPGGVTVLVAASREIYFREWVSFSSAGFPDNHAAKDGETVRIIINDLGDRRAVEDTLWSEGAYIDTFRKTALQLVMTKRPVVAPDDQYTCEWISERTCAPWIIFVLRKPRAA